jgi:hypothetical protein
MSPKHHFAEYARRNPKQYQAFSDSMWNGFVSITHKFGLSPFFSFTPEFLQDLNGEAIGKQLGEVYELSQGNTGRFAEGEIPGDQEQTIQQLPPIE